MFARLEVLRLHRLLRPLDAIRDHLRLDRHAFFHPQPLQQRAHPLLGEDPHQVVFERQIEPRLARIALPSRASPELVVDAPRLMSLRPQNEQPSGRDHLLVIRLRRLRMALQRLRPIGIGNLELLPLVVEPQKPRRRHRVDRSLVGADRPRLALLHQLLPRHEVRIAAQQNIGPAPGHIGRDGHHPQPSRLRHNLRLALVELRVQHHVPHALPLQNPRKPLALLDRRSPHQHRLFPLVQHRDVVGRRLVLLLLRPVHHVRILQPPQRHVGRNHHDLQLVDLLELRRLRLRRARHPAQLLVQPEVVLERDRRQRLVFLADVHALLGLDRLVQPVAPAPSRHQPPGEGVHDDHLAVLHHVLHVPLVERVRLDRRLHIVLQFPVLRIGNVADPQQPLDRHPPLVRHSDGPLFLVHNVVAGQILVLALFNLLAQLQLRDDLHHPLVLVRRLVRRSGNNQRRPRLVDQDRVHLVHDPVVVPPLHAIF